MVRHADGRAAESDRARRHMHQRPQIVLDPVLDAQRITQVTDAPDLRGNEHQQQGEREPPNHAHGRRRGSPCGSERQPNAPAPHSIAPIAAGKSR